MSTTVGGLLDRFHVLGSVPTAQTEATLEEIEQGWRELARTTSGLLNALPVEQGSVVALSRDVALDALQRLAGRRWGETAPHATPLAEMAMVAGAISDVLVAHRSPFTVAPEPTRRARRAEPWPYQPRPADNAAAAPIQQAVLAAVGEAAAWSLDRLHAMTPRPELARDLLHVAVITEQFRRPGRGHPRSHLEHLAVHTTEDRSLTGAVQRWGGEAEQALHRASLSTGSMAMMAADLFILAGAVKSVVPTESAPQVAEAIAQAQQAWRRLAAWPATELQLGGKPPVEFVAASRALRAPTSALLRGEGGWRPAEAIRQRYSSYDLDTFAYAAATTSQRVGAAFHLALQEAGTGHSRLWRSLDSALELDPTIATTTATRHPSRRAPSILPRRWVLIPDPGADVQALIGHAADAADHSQTLANHVRALLTSPGGTAGQYEVVPSQPVGRGARREPMPATHRSRPMSSLSY
ncbi:hypothetical protein [Propioniciclava soli]|uniref:hypothetical protein n=1 Tax=Propioniciclava soli TaxID=2775081 RepID=UPI001E2F0003|nr:hypothetical protein [Propioniciclava soli]